MLRRLLRIGAFSALSRAWSERSKKWLWIAEAMILLVFIDSRAAAASRKAKERAQS